APFSTFKPRLAPWRDGIAIGVLLLGVASALGVSAVGLIVRVIAVVGAAAAAGYLTQCGRAGNVPARMLAPAAVILAVVAAAVAFHAAGLLPASLVAPAAIGGFSAAGAMLIALACAFLAKDAVVSAPAREPVPVPVPVKTRPENPAEHLAVA